MRARSSIKIALVATVIGLLLGAYRFGVLDRLADPQRLKDTLLELGTWGYVAFVVAYALLQPFGVPGTVFIVAAPLIWPWPVAFGLSMMGTMAASVVGFSFARFIARDWIAAKIPARFRKYDDALARRAFTTVFLLRLIFWMPPMLHAFFGVSKVRFTTHFWGSLAGYVVPLLLVSYFGERLFATVRAMPAWLWLVIAVAVAFALLIAVARRLRRREPHATSQRDA